MLSCHINKSSRNVRYNANVWSIKLQIESNSSTVKHSASGVTLHQNMFGVRFDPIRPDVLVNVSGLMRVKYKFNRPFSSTLNYLTSHY